MPPVVVSPPPDLPKESLREKFARARSAFVVANHGIKAAILVGVLFLLSASMLVVQHTIPAITTGKFASHVCVGPVCLPSPLGHIPAQSSASSGPAGNQKNQKTSSSMQPTPSNTPSAPNQQSQPKAVQANTNFSVQVGPEEYVAGPSRDFDTNVVFAPSGNSVLAYDANSTTHVYSGPNLSTINWSAPSAALAAGPADHFDDCGAWLIATYKVTSTHWVGWYHAEYPCTPSSSGYPAPQGSTYWSVAFTESFDGGKTWKKTGYPNNQVLTGDKQDINTTKYRFSGTNITSDGTYLYMESADAALATIARAKISDLGKPGTWYKWYCSSSTSCGFTQPGVGGHMTFVRDLGGEVLYDTYLGEYISIMNTQGYGDTYGRKGFSLTVAPKGNTTSWTPFNNSQTIYPIVSYTADTHVDHWSYNQTGMLAVYAYPTMVDPYGNGTQVGQFFYLYYMKVFQNDLFSARYLFRRSIYFSTSSTSSYRSTVQLTRYYNSAQKKLLVSTESARPSEGYVHISNIGRLQTYPSPGFKPLYLCYIPAWQDYLPSVADPSKYNWQHCESPTGDAFVRTLGYISTTQTTATPVAIYRCSTSTPHNHFISTDPKCEGKTYNFRLGFIFKE